ncbi:alpha-mannosidase [Tessaracoccus massiliensis]|uniref:alpha-mannosidase n=1 Tax=Tessaracoccus massiliensis TaxID=1522311 RepID=UPI00058DC4E5|nr:glycoside hydrolase family 38 C-terminal domain-containing protein [Tessaracoccus massiliensis]
MHDDRELVEERIEKLRERVAERIYAVVVPVEVAAWQVPGEPVPFADAAAADYGPFPLDTLWGPAWSTWWLKLRAQIPAERLAERIELRIDLGFVGDWAGNQSEGMVYTADGWPLKAVNPMNRTVALTFGGLAGERALVGDDGAVDLFVEAAANPDMTRHLGHVTHDGDTETRSERPLWRFGGADLVVRDDDVWGLHMDLDVLDGLMRQLPKDATWRATLLRGLEDAADVLDTDGIDAGAARARGVLAPLIASGAAGSAQQMTAVGHAHIDTAWLWPIRETRRKIVRTFSNVVALADEYPEFRFANSAPQHHLWMKEDSPEIYQRVRAAIERGQWQFVGGMWIEPDAMMPSGEALARQFTSGIRFMEAEFGVTTNCLWLPDSFGYNGQLPQLARLAGMDWFLTQKLSWNRTNSLPHHTFWWEGLDGTRIWTHFPPCDSYDSIVSAEEVLGAERNFKEKGRARHSLLPYGYGDGGGGPVREMVERVARFADLEGAPVVTHGTPAEFERAARAEYDPPVWTGELYLEFHRGIFTSLIELKQGNRRSEAALQAVEWLWTLAAQAGADYPHAQLEELWRRVLVLQFHDILPGSSTSWVNREAVAEYATILAELDDLFAEAWSVLSTDGGVSVVNPSDVARTEVVEIDGSLQVVSVPPLSSVVPERASATEEPGTTKGRVQTTRDGEHLILANGLLRVQIEADGTVGQITDLEADRDVLLPGRRGNVLRLHPDHPSCFDAWELEAQYTHSVTELTDADAVDIILDDPLRATVEVTRRFGDSTATQRITLDAGSRAVDFDTTVDWREREKLLKVSFPVDVRATHCVAETQFGHIERPIAVNTPWDAARFETVHQRWLLLREPGYGVTLATDSGYGHDVTPAGGSEATPICGVDARLSLLRAPNSPDPTADLGEHTLRYSLTVGTGIAEAHAAGVRLNQPLQIIDGVADVAAPVSLTPLDGTSLAVLDAIKAAFDGSGDLIVRLHEAAGARSRVRLTVPEPVAAVTEVNLLEHAVDEPTQNLPAAGASDVELRLRPFQILTLRIRTTS